MASTITYDEIFSRFYTKVRAYDFIYESYSDDMVEEFMISWLHSAVSYPYIRRLFSSITLSDDTMSIDYQMAYATDEYSDQWFVTEVLSYSMVYSWVEPKVRSITTITQNFTTSDEKFYSQSQHLGELRQLLSDSELRIRALIRDRGYFYNTYLDGTTPSRRQS